MITYEYLCDNCNATFQIRRSITADNSAPQCPSCQSARVRRVYTPVFVLARGTDGAFTEIGGNACGGCAATSCAGCAVRS